MNGSDDFAQPLSFGEWLSLSRRLSVEVCPNCQAEVGQGMCCMTYTEWHCWGCGARLDSRVVSPLTVYACQNEWPDYKPTFGESRHPIACSCSGRGWYPYDEHPTLRHGYQPVQSGRKDQADG